jgi:hypothetical protein
MSAKNAVPPACPTVADRSETMPKKQVELGGCLREGTRNGDGVSSFLGCRPAARRARPVPASYTATSLVVEVTMSRHRAAGVSSQLGILSELLITQNRSGREVIFEMSRAQFALGEDDLRNRLLKTFLVHSPISELVVESCFLLPRGTASCFMALKSSATRLRCSAVRSSLSVNSTKCDGLG